MRLHRILFYLLLVFLPVQLGRHFWPDFAFVSGIRVDYLAPIVYLTDLLVVGILGAWLWEKVKSGKWEGKRGKWRKENLNNFIFPISVLIFLLINVLLAQNQGAALYKFVKIIEFALLGFYISKNNYTLYAIRHTLPLAVAYSSFIALAQFLKQVSLGGLFWWLGERTFNLSTPGIARAVWGGQLILRPYATFPHPNVLAGFTLVVVILLLGNFKSANQLINKLTNLKLEIEQLGDWLIGIYWLLVLILGLTALAISLSRSAWIVGALVCSWLVIRYLRMTKPSKKFLYFVVCLPARALATAGCLLFVVGALFYCAFQLSTEEALVQRLHLNQTALEMIKQSPIIGVGLNNFIPRLPDFWPKLTTTRFLQPVHNIFLLVAAETGLIGLLIFLWFLILTFKKLLITNNQSLITALSAILALGLFDHYWLTLQQTQLLFTIVLGLSWGTKKARIKKR